MPSHNVELSVFIGTVSPNLSIERTAKSTLCAAPVAIREAARRVGRDVKAVHGDVTALLNAGVLSRAEGGGIIFPYEAVKVEFVLQAP